MIRKYHNLKLHTNLCDREGEPHNKQRKPISSLFPNEMVSKLECTKSNAQQNLEQLQNPTTGVTINNESTTTEPLP